jgi:predicted enzyme related to lactoylglutathione lyase
MQRVTGIGGIFFQARDPAALRDWYRRHLGIDAQAWGGAMLPATSDTVWTIGDAAARPYAPGSAPFMINYRVADLAALLQVLRAEGCQVEDETSDSAYGKFGWVIDPEGNKVELWEPPA